MGYCWYCYWGWPKPVADIYQEALAALDGDEMPLHYGPAHIVWADENFGREHVQWCLDQIANRRYCDDRTEAEIAIIKQSLERLLELPDKVLNPQPASFDDDRWNDDPANHPPPAGLEMIKVHF